MSASKQDILQPVYEFARIVGDLLFAALRRWPIVLITVLLCVAAAIFVGRSSKPQYSSQMLVMAAPAQNNAVQSAIGSTLSSARSLSAFGFGGVGGSSQFKTYIQLAQSTAVAESIMSKPDDVAWLFGPSIDPRTGMYHVSPWSPRQLLYGLFGLSAPVKPTVQDVERAIDRTIAISVVADNQDIASLSCTSEVPQACPKILMDVHQATEEHLGAISLSDARKLSQYIMRILPTVQEQVVRDSLVDLLAGATKQIAMGELHQAVGAVVISPPYVSSQPSFPQPSFLIASAMAVGLFLGCILAWVLPQFRFNLRIVQRARSLRSRVASLLA